MEQNVVMSMRNIAMKQGAALHAQQCARGVNFVQLSTHTNIAHAHEMLAPKSALTAPSCPPGLQRRPSAGRTR